MSYKEVGLHSCDLSGLNKDSYLPKLSPRAPLYMRLYYSMKKLMVPSYYYEDTKYYYRSNAMLVAEKQRMVNECHPLIVHPFSIISLARRIIIFQLWLINYFRRFLVLTFHYSVKIRMDHPSHWPHRWFVIVTSFIYFLNMLLNLVTGYREIDKKRIELDLKKIVRRYLKTYFILDVMDIYPVISMCFIHRENESAYWVCIEIVVVYVSQMPRLRQFLRYFSTTLYVCKVPRFARNICSVVLMTVLALHWFTCILYALPRVLHNVRHTVPDEQVTSFENNSVVEQYINSLDQILPHFFRCSAGAIEVPSTEEMLTLIIVLMFAFFFHIYVVVYVLNKAKKAGLAENKYESFRIQLKNYMKSKNISARLRAKILLFYDYKNLKKHFNEQAIHSTLSEHLRCEMILHHCSHMLNNVKLFEGLPKSTIGPILALLEFDCYCPNDVIIKQEDAGELVVFISYGTAATYLTKGTEILHLGDGDVLGILGFYMGDTCPITCVAVGFMEAFKLERKHLQRIIKQNPEINERLEALYKFRLKYLENVEEITSPKNQQQIIEMLRVGKILEQQRRRSGAASSTRDGST